MQFRAIDSTGAASLSNEASAITSSDTIAPSIPLNLKSTYTTPSTISIAWTASLDNVAVESLLNLCEWYFVECHKANELYFNRTYNQSALRDICKSC